MSFLLRYKWLSLVSICLILTLGTVMVITVRSVARATGGSITLSVSSGPPTTAVTITGSSFGASETVTLNVDTTQVGTANSDTTGAFSTSLTIPATTPPGIHTISATGQTSTLSAQASFTVQTDWSEFGFDVLHSHFNPYENILSVANVPQLTSYWKTAAQSGIYSEPVVANGIVYVTTRTGYLQAFDAIKGTKLWTFTTPQHNFGDTSVAVTNGVVYAASGNSSGPSKGSEVDALKATTGTKLWTTPIANTGVSTTPTVANGIVYVGTVDHGLYAFDATTGAQKWISAVSGVTSSPTAISSLDGSGNPTGSLYVGTASVHNGVTTNHLSVIDIATGTIPSSFSTAGTVTAQTVINGKLYISTQGGTTTGTTGCYTASSACAFDLTTSKRVWMYPDPAGYGFNGLAVANGVVYVNSGSTTAGSGTITALDATAGTTSWNTTTGGQSTDLSIANGVLYATFSDKTVKAFDISTGTQLWSASDPLGFGDGVAVVNGVIYVGSVSTEMDAFYVFVPDTNAAIKLSPAAGPPNTIITVNGTGFGTNEPVALTFNNVTAGTATTDGTGAFSGPVTVPTATAPGTYVLQATGQSSGATAQANFQVQASWSMFGADAQHTHVNPYENVLTNANVSGLKVHWQVSTGKYVYASVAVANGIAYVGSVDQTMYAINTTTGKVVWHYNAGGAIYSSPAVVDGIVYFGANIVGKTSTTGKLFALKANSGGKVWVQAIAAPFTSSPVVANGLVYLGSDGGKLYAYDAYVGTLKWSAATGTSLRSSPTVANGIVYITSDNHKLYAFTATGCGQATCQPLWSYAAGGSVVSSPAVVNGVVYFGAQDGRLYAVDANAGKLLWVVPTGNQLNSSPAIANGVVYIGSYDHKVYAFNASTGTTLWVYATGNLINSSPTVANGVVYVGSYDHKLYALDATAGTLLWSYTTNGVINSSPAVVDGIVYVGSYDHNVYAFSLT